MKVTAKKSHTFYVRAARRLLKGIEAKPVREGNETLWEKLPVEALRISGLGKAVNSAILAATVAEAEGLCTIARIQTAYPMLRGSAHSGNCAQIVIDVKRK